MIATKLLAISKTVLSLMLIALSVITLTGCQEDSPNQELLSQVEDHQLTSESLQGLIKAGAEIDFIGDEGHSPLVWASGLGQTEIVELLLDQGADPNQTVSDSFEVLFASESNPLKQLELTEERNA